MTFYINVQYFNHCTKLEELVLFFIYIILSAPLSRYLFYKCNFYGILIIIVFSFSYIVAVVVIKTGHKVEISHIVAVDGSWFPRRRSHDRFPRHGAVGSS